MAEAQIEIPVCLWAEADGWYCRKVQIVGRRGFPDRLFIKAGRVVLIEFKDEGEGPRPLQSREIDALKEAGAEVYVCDNVYSACDILGIEPKGHWAWHRRRTET